MKLPSSHTFSHCRLRYFLGKSMVGVVSTTRPSCHPGASPSWPLWLATVPLEVPMYPLWPRRPSLCTVWAPSSWEDLHWSMLPWERSCQRRTSEGPPCTAGQSGPWINIKMSSHQYRKSHCGDKTVVRSSYLHSGISYTGKMTSLYWTNALVPSFCVMLHLRFVLQKFARNVADPHKNFENALIEIFNYTYHW